MGIGGVHCGGFRRRNLCASLAARARMGSVLTGFSQFDFNPKLDFGQHSIQAGITGRGLEVGGGISQPVYRGGIEIPRQ